MKLIDALKEKGTPFEIPDCNRADLPQFFVDMGYRVGVEIGVYKAKFTKALGQTGMRIYGVDPWKIYNDYGVKRKYHALNQERQDFLFKYAQHELAPYLNCTLIRKTSMEAVQDFADESLDFVYIDGHHGFKYIAEDLWDWSKKIRKGGIISGHDYDYDGLDLDPLDPYVRHVKLAVNAYTQALNIDNWYILGREEKRRGEKRDKWRSFMWVKT